MNFLKGFVLALIVSLMPMAGFLLKADHWGGLVGFFCLSIPFALIQGAFLTPFFRMRKQSPFFARVISASIVGFFSGSMCIVFLGMFWNWVLNLCGWPQWFVLLWSFQPWFCWTGAACGVTFIACSESNCSGVWIVKVATLIGAMLFITASFF